MKLERAEKYAAVILRWLYVACIVATLLGYSTLVIVLLILGHWHHDFWMWKIEKEVFKEQLENLSQPEGGK